MKRKKKLNLVPKMLSFFVYFLCVWIFAVVFLFGFGGLFCADEEISAFLRRLGFALPSLTGLHMASFVNCIQRKNSPGKHFAPPAVTTNTMESFIKQFMNEYRRISSILTFTADEHQEMEAASSTETSQRFPTVAHSPH